MKKQSLCFIHLIMMGTLNLPLDMSGNDVERDGEGINSLRVGTSKLKI